jgi:hypothetical protein
MLKLSFFCTDTINDERFDAHTSLLSISASRFRNGRRAREQFNYYEMSLMHDCRSQEFLASLFCPFNVFFEN